MFEGVGLWTILGTMSTMAVGITTPLDCYVGLGIGSDSVAFEIDDPNGILGCQYDINNTRLFVEHMSSPASGSDHPGANYAGVKQLFPVGSQTDLYLGGAYALDSDQMDGGVYAIAGLETGGESVKIYSEYITPVSGLSDGMAHTGVKFIF